MDSRNHEINRVLETYEPDEVEEGVVETYNTVLHEFNEMQLYSKGVPVSQSTENDEETPLIHGNLTTFTSKPGIFYSEIIRWANQNEMLKKAFLYPPVLYQFKDGLSLYSHANYLCRITSVPTIGACDISSASLINQIFSIFSNMSQALILNGLWSTAFYGLFIYDWMNYTVYPDGRYDTTAAQLWWGTADNPSVLTSSWGSDLPSQPLYWIAPTIVAVPLAYSLLAGLVRSMFDRNTCSSDVHVNVLRYELNNGEKHWLKDTLRWFNPFPRRFQTALKRSIFALQWNKEVDFNEKLELLKLIKDVAGSHSSITQIQAIYALGEIANTHRSVARRLLALTGREKFEFEKIEVEALNELTQLTQPPTTNLKNRTRSFYANYVLWQHGYKVGAGLQILFATMFVMEWFSKGRLAAMLWQKGKGAYDYYQAKSKCEDADKVLAYVDAWAKDVCEICPDWDEVYLGDRDTSQGCLDGLLTSEKQPDDIVKNIDRVLKHPDFKTIDFTKQNISRWDEPELGEFLDKITAHKPQLDTFNLSRPVLSDRWTPADKNKIKQVAGFLNRAHVKVGDLNNQNMGDEIAETFFSELQPSSVEQLNLPNNALGDKAANSAADFINRSNNTLSSINLSRNQITDEGAASVIRAAAGQSSMTSIDVGYNRVGQGTIDVIAEVLPTSSFKTVRLSGVNFARIDATPLWRALANATQVEEIYLDNTQLSADDLANAAPYMPLWSAKRIDLSGNDIGVEAVDYLCQGLTNNTVVAGIILDRNPLTDAGVQMIGQCIETTGVTELSLNECSFTAEGFTAIIPNLQKASQLQKFCIAGNRLGDKPIINFSQMLANGTLPLRWFDGSANNLSDKSGVVLAEAITHSNTTTVILADNQLGNKTAKAFAKILANSSLKTLILTGNQLDANSVEELAAALPGSSLTEIIISNNPGSGVRAIARQLVTPTPSAKDDQPEISIEARRALYNSKPNTQLQVLGVDNTNMDNSDARELCRTAPRSGIPFKQIKTSSNPKVTEVDLRNCHVSSAQDLMPPSAYRWLQQAARYQWADEEEDNIAMAVEHPNVLAYDNAQAANSIDLTLVTTRPVVVPSPQLALPTSTPTLFLPAQQNSQASTSANLSLVCMLGGVIPVINSLILLYVLYRLLSPLCSRVYNAAYQHAGLFGGSQSSEKKEFCPAMYQAKRQSN